MIAAVLLPLLQLVASAQSPLASPDDAVQSMQEAAPACAAPGSEEGQAPEGESEAGERYVLPETGFTFVIPGTGEDAIPAEALPPCTPEPVRPRNLDIFGFYALPVAGEAMGARWRQGALLDLPEGSAQVAALVWGIDRPGGNPLDLVNRRVNAEFRYVDDAGKDRWASAAETVARGAGDCEDLAILKLALLARAGIESDRLFLVVVRDTARQTDHAVAAVRWENRLWVLDNRIDRLQPAERIMDYVPLQSFSGQWAWTYGYKSGSSAGRAARAIMAAPRPGR